MATKVQTKRKSIRHKTQFSVPYRESSTSPWKLLTDEFLLDPSEGKLNILISSYRDQLLLDKENADKKLEITDCAICAPRQFSSLNKTHQFADKLATATFPPRNLDKKGQVWSNIQYTNLITTLSALYRKQQKELFDKEQAIKKAQLSQYGKLWCSLKSRPVHHSVISPSAMPVSVPPLDEFKPFLTYLDSNKEIIPNTFMKNYVGEYCMKFERGALYTDGRMDLCKQVIGPDWISNLMNSLKNNSQVRHFLLGNNIINTTGAKAIAEFLSNERKCKIETWYLAGNSINDEGIKYICDALKHDKDMKYLWLKRNPITAKGITHISELLKVNNNIRILDLHNIALYDEGLKILCEGLKENTSLRQLYLGANNITSKGATYIAEYFVERTKSNVKGITSIWFDMNRLEDIGACAILDAVKDYPYMKRFVMGSNGLTATTAKKMYECFANNKLLKVLDIGMYKATGDMGEISNRIEDTGAEYIAKLMTENRCIKVLSVINNGITETGIEALSKALAVNDTVLYLNFDQFGLDGIAQKLNEDIRNKLKVNRKLAEDNGTFEKERFIKHSKKIVYIDSVYRNSDKS